MFDETFITKDGFIVGGCAIQYQNTLIEQSCKKKKKNKQKQQLIQS